MKKIFSMMAIAAMAFAVSCGGDDDQNVDPNPNPNPNPEGPTPTEVHASLKGSAYFPIILDGPSYETVMTKVVADLRPDEETKFLYVWDGTYVGGTATPLNFYGNTDGCTCLEMGSAGWAGAGFFCSSVETLDKLAVIMENPGAWYLHIGILSAASDQYAHTLRLADGSNSVDLVLKAGGDYNYTRDGEWQEIEVPMTYFTDKGLNYRTGTAELNVVAIVDADNQPVAVPGTTVNYDALFFYKK